MSLAKRVASGLVWNQIYVVISFVLSLAFTLFIVRQFDRYTYSIYVFAAVFVGIILRLISFGFENIINKYIPEYLSKGSITLSRSVFNRLLLLRSFILLNICVIILLAQKLLLSLLKMPEIATLLGYLLAIVMVRGTYNLFPSVYMAQLKVKQVRIIELCNQAFHLLIVYCVLAIFQAVNIKYIFLSQLLIDGIILVLYCILLHKSWRGLTVQSENPEFRSLYKFGLYFWGVNLLNYLLAEKLDIFLLGILNPDKEQIAIYNIGVMITIKTSILVMGSLRGLLLPTFSDAYTKKKEDGIVQVWVVFFKVLIISIIPTFFFLFFFGNHIITFLFTSNYVQSVVILRLSIGFAFFTWLWGSGLSMITLMTLNKGRIVLWIKLGAGLLNLLLNLILIPLYGAIGAIIATGLCQLLGSIAEFHIMQRYIKVPYPLLLFGKLILISSIPLLVVMWLPAKGLGQLVLSGGIYIMLFLFIAHFIKLLTPDERQQLTEHGVFKYLAKVF